MSFIVVENSSAYFSNLARTQSHHISISQPQPSERRLLGLKSLTMEEGMFRAKSRKIELLRGYVCACLISLL